MALDRWAQWATIIGLPLAALATFATLEALHSHSTSTTPPIPSISSSAAAGVPSSPPSSSQSVTAALESHAPQAFASTCRALAADIQTAGLTAAIVCSPTGSNAPGSVQYYQYVDAADMNTAFGNYAGGATSMPWALGQRDAGAPCLSATVGDVSWLRGCCRGSGGTDEAPARRGSV